MDELFALLMSFPDINYRKIWLESGKKNIKTVIFVTHNVDEAVFLADRIVVLSPGLGELLKPSILNWVDPRPYNTRISRS
jgi:NitT/TauT family transport system ATP-binding protein